ncbi:MAG: hypothetical protein ACW99G_23620, partial [Candidatus Thorarchaeota archaeon]
MSVIDPERHIKDLYQRIDELEAKLDRAVELHNAMARKYAEEKGRLDKLDSINNPEDQGEFIYLWDEDFGDIREAIDKLEESEC